MKLHISLIVVLLFVITGCDQGTVIPPTQPTFTPEQTPATSSDANNNSAIITYVDQRSGIAFDYPSEWELLTPPAEEAVGYTYSLATYNATNPSAPSNNSESSLPGGETKIDITFYSDGETPENAIRTVQSDVESGMAIIVKEEKRTEADGSTAYYYKVNGRLGGTAQALYLSVNGRTVSIVSYGDGEHFEDIAKSLRRA